MKKILFLIIALSAMGITTSNAQEKADTYTIGGSFNFAVSTMDSNENMITSTKFRIAPEFGYFITDKIKVGGEIGYAYSSDLHTIAITPNIAYHQPIIDKLYYTPQLNISGGVEINPVNEIGIFSISLNLAQFEYMPTSNFGISTSLINLSYSLIDWTYNRFDLGLLNSLSIGFHYYF
jgi:hypothetical protein